MALLEAKAINAHACAFCPAVHVNFLDALGQVFATASVPIENAEPFIAQFRAAMAELAARHSAPATRQ